MRSIAFMCLAIAFGVIAQLRASEAQAPGAAEQVPDLSGFWARQGRMGSVYQAPPSGPGPVLDPIDRDAPGLLNGGRGIPFAGDYTNPILKPFAAEIVKERGEREVAGEEILPAYSLCWPSGVPMALNLRENVHFLQTLDQIVILHQRDHMVRRIDLNAEHPKDLSPSWHGHSVGHYEGSTLVVDTVAIDPRAELDRFGTPQSPQLHVVERYRISGDGKALHVLLRVEDPETFTMAWSGTVTYYRSAAPWEESICAENNRTAGGGFYPVPIAAKQDF